MIQFRNGYYADVRVEDRCRTVISYKAGKLAEMRNRRERQDSRRGDRRGNGKNSDRGSRRRDRR